jgi:hypothetical protein
LLEGGDQGYIAMKQMPRILRVESSSGILDACKQIQKLNECLKINLDEIEHGLSIQELGIFS